ncbi:beta-ketoacyl-ACP synthase I [Vibrio maerlii]|uniref:beta-ketoacyl-ACP synthase I n=1 Tax=Vibrio maerlii TaxID=2231648 RepID=UPI000E3C9854|nr:beta-ketoacyl-ACP synthase I [Vibrio maerlii]
MKRAVITGIGIISSIGNNAEEVTDSLRNAKSGITYSKEFEEMGLRSKVWGALKIDPKEHIDRKTLRFMGDASAYAYLSMQQAIKDAKLTPEQISNPRTGLVVGSGGASGQSQVQAADTLREKGVRRIGPYLITQTMASTASATLATPFKIKGLSYSLSSACATGSHAIGHAWEQIQLGNQDIIFAGAGDELNWTQAMGFDAMGALSTKYNDNPSEASRPYDSERDGFVISGGGGIVVVEELEHALARGAHIYAEIVGYGATSDGDDMVAPSGEGAARCMTMALEKAERNGVTKVDYLNTHGTSTPVGDTKELAAVLEVFGDHLPMISSTKSMAGHGLGAAGIHEAIYSLLMMENGFVAPSINVKNLDEKLVDLPIVTETQDHDLKAVMSNSFGFGGTNATLVFKQFQR